MKNRFGITDDDINKCNDAGISDMNKIVYVKKLTTKYSEPVDKILQYYSEKKDWDDVIVRLEVSANEK